MGQTGLHLSATSAWESEAEMARLSAELIVHVEKAIKAEESGLRYEDYLFECDHKGFIDPDEESRYYEETGAYYAENINKLNTLLGLLTWLKG